MAILSGFSFADVRSFVTMVPINSPPCKLNLPLAELLRPHRVDSLAGLIL